MDNLPLGRHPDGTPDPGVLAHPDGPPESDEQSETMSAATRTKLLPGDPQLDKADEGRPAGRSNFLVEFWRSDVGKKWLMAVSGLMLMGFVLFHMVGNLKLYLGAEDVNHYGEFLRELLVPILPRTVALWLFRLGLVAAFAVHIAAAASLTKTNRDARKVPYKSERDYIAANFASRTMRMTGIVIALFLLFHLADLTWGRANPDFVRGDVYCNVYYSFSRPWVAIIYILANLALGIHLYHGGWSLFQSLGWNSPRFNPWRRWFAIGFALVVVVPNISFPISVLTEVIGPCP